MKKVIALLVLVSLTTACTSEENEASSLVVDPVEASIESGITMISGIPDEQSGSILALKTNAQELNPDFFNLFLTKAYADNCVRAFFDTCISGEKSVEYNGCEVPNTSRSIEGNVLLSYSQNDCSLLANNDFVTRTYDIQISGARGGVVTHTSALQSDYNGNTYGGGGRLTKTAAGWALEIAGRHSNFVYRSRQLFDVSIRTLAPISISGSLSRATRLINGGQLQVNHNVTGFTSTITPNNLRWSNSCCHPTSGSLSIVFSGSRTGSASVVFNGCGTAVVNDGGQESNIELSYCE
jgi:hypothetical protein